MGRTIKTRNRATFWLRWQMKKIADG